VADLEVLAERAEQVARAEEDRSRASPSDEWPFLAVVGIETGNARFSPGATETLLPGESINSALPRAQAASAQPSDRFGGPFAQAALAMEFEV